MLPSVFKGVTWKDFEEALQLSCRILTFLATEQQGCHSIEEAGGYEALCRLLRGCTPPNSGRDGAVMTEAAKAASEALASLSKRMLGHADLHFAACSGQMDETEAEVTPDCSVETPVNLSLNSELPSEEWEPTQEQVEELGLGVQDHLRRLSSGTTMAPSSRGMAHDGFLAHLPYNHRPSNSQEELDSANLEAPSQHIMHKNQLMCSQMQSPMPSDRFLHHCPDMNSSGCSSVLSLYDSFVVEDLTSHMALGISLEA